MRSDENGPYVSPLAGGNNLRERTLRKAGVATNGSPQTEMGSNGGPYQNAQSPKVLFTINHVDKRTKGFVDFDLQMTRPEIPASNAHDLRFEPYNYFPPHYSSTQHTRLVNF